jgi:hypothetical protein
VTRGAQQVETCCNKTRASKTRNRLTGLILADLPNAMVRRDQTPSMESLVRSTCTTHSSSSEVPTNVAIGRRARAVAPAIPNTHPRLPANTITEYPALVRSQSKKPSQAERAASVAKGCVSRFRNLDAGEPASRMTPMHRAARSDPLPNRFRPSCPAVLPPPCCHGTETPLLGPSHPCFPQVRNKSTRLAAEFELLRSP